MITYCMKRLLLIVIVCIPSVVFSTPMDSLLFRAPFSIKITINGEFHFESDQDSSRTYEDSWVISYQITDTNMYHVDSNTITFGGITMTFDTVTKTVLSLSY